MLQHAFYKVLEQELEDEDDFDQSSDYESAKTEKELFRYMFAMTC